MKFLYLVIFLAGLITGCTKDNPAPADGPADLNLSRKSLEILSTENQFGFELFQNLVQADSGKNMMISPLSISIALSMTLNGAGGETFQDMVETLHLPNDTPGEFNEAMSEIITALTNADEKVTLNITQSIWYRQGFQVNPDFLETNKNYYDARISALDFNNPAAKDMINNWVNEATNGKIPKIVEHISPLDMMFLINAIYFYGTWTYSFDKSETKDLPFFIEPGNSIDVPMMSRQGDFAWFGDDQVSGIELDYGRGNFSMIVLVPKDGHSPVSFAEGLNPGKWQNLTDHPDTLRNTKIYLPKIRYEYSRILNQPLSDLGMGIAFDPNRADFSGINPDTVDLHLHISKVMHKTFIEVNEEGTEAAAVTSVTIGITTAEPQPEFVVNKPFLYFIREKTTGAILFMGYVRNPLDDGAN